MSSMMLTRVPYVEGLVAQPTVAPPGESATAGSGNGHRNSYFRSRFRRIREGEDDVLREPRLPLQPGEALYLGSRVDVLV